MSFLLPLDGADFMMQEKQKHTIGTPSNFMI
jgi:hypothetical protein